MTCSGDEYNECLSCDANKNRTLIGNECLCDTGYYDDNASE